MYELGSKLVMKQDHEPIDILIVFNKTVSITKAIYTDDNNIGTRIFSDQRSKRGLQSHTVIFWVMAMCSLVSGY
jgi:hypothetical protein